MKKIFNLILAALVIIGAASCTKNEEVAYQGGEGLSFYAEIVNGDTRAEIVKGDGNTWNTIWKTSDKINVTYSDKTYTFIYGDGKFTCSEPGVTSLIGKTVTIEPVANLDSKAGNSAWSFTSVEVADFGADETVQLEANTSFFRYTYNGSEDITFTVTADKKVFVVDSDVTDTVTISGVSGENFVAFWTDNSGNALNATLSYSIGGVKCKEKNIALYPGKVYNLGILTPESDVWGTAGTHNTWAASTPEKVYDGGTYLVAYNLAGDTQLKFVKIGASNNGWDGAIGGKPVGTATEAGVWTDVSDNNITLPAEGTYDVYLLPTFKYCVVKAGTAPEEFVAPTYDLYLKPNSNWLQGNARFAAYFFNGTGNIWADLTAVENGIYAVNLPTGYVNGDNVIFCRMNPSSTANSWSTKWNQTEDLVIPTDGKNLYTVKEDTWDKGGGSWSTK